jgi:3-hydroxyacyl-CoA dehydrogenase/enoyl-CoA hydratase/3-hydroxybutyryl-CoA epimerase
VAEQTRKDLAAEGRTHAEHPAMPVIRRLCEIGRVGRKAGKGFYDWPGESAGSSAGEAAGRSAVAKRLWPGLAQQWPPAAKQPEQHELIDRLLFAQANEAARCYEEGVVRSVADANVGSILGWGFAPFHGGTLQFVNAVGARRFVERSRELAKKHGARFEPAAIIVRQAEASLAFAD